MDLERADLYGVAKDSGCGKLLKRLQTEDVHTRHALDFMGKCTKYERDMAKKLSHAADYLVGMNKAVYDTGLSKDTILAFLRYWFTEYPEIKEWHERIKMDLYTKRMVKNAFGFRKPLFDRVDSALPEFVAWIPQSTVGIVINIALNNIAKNLPQVTLLLQVHDSLAMQVPTSEVAYLIPLIRQQSLIPIPYPESITIPVSFKTSELSWGDVKDYRLETRVS